MMKYLAVSLLALSLVGCDDGSSAAPKQVNCVWTSPNPMPAKVKDSLVVKTTSFEIVSSAFARGGFSGGRSGGFSSRGYGGSYRPAPSYRPSYTSPRTNPTPRTTPPSNRVPLYSPTKTPGVYSRPSGQTVYHHHDSGSWLPWMIIPLMFMSNGSPMNAAQASTCLAYEYEGKISLTETGKGLVGK